MQWYFALSAQIFASRYTSLQHPYVTHQAMTTSNILICDLCTSFSWVEVLRGYHTRVSICLLSYKAYGCRTFWQIFYRYMDMISIREPIDDLNIHLFPGSISCNATSFYHERVVIYPVKLVGRGHYQATLRQDQEDGVSSREW